MDRCTRRAFLGRAACLTGAAALGFGARAEGGAVPRIGACDWSMGMGLDPGDRKSVV